MVVVNQHQPASFMNGRDKLRELKRTGSPCEAAFTLKELVLVLAVLGLLALLLLPAMARNGNGSHRALCHNNMKHIVLATAMYATDNNDLFTHPSWGSIGASAGPNNWCSATLLSGVGPIPNADGLSGPFAHTNQLPFYQAGQLASFLPGQRTLVCPTDWQDSMTVNSALYRLRQLKLTSYGMSGLVMSPPNGGPQTQKMSPRRPNDIFIYEPNELLAFNFNDAGQNPYNSSESATSRHEGGTIVGTVGGGAEFMTLGYFWRLQGVSYSGVPFIPAPNRLLWPSP